jgi:hypothetical protein
MKYLRLFEQKSYEERVAEICQKYNIKNWSINSEGLVDVNGYVYLQSKRLTKLPLNFGYVAGNFLCWDNKLASLEGCPREVGGNFDCQSNKLNSLKGSPQVVRGDFYCTYNELTSLEGGPHTVGGGFSCVYNKLTSLRFAPDEVEGGVFVLPNPISDIPKKYLTQEHLEFIVKEQYDWRLYHKDGSMRLDRLEQMIEWGIETNKIYYLLTW